MKTYEIKVHRDGKWWMVEIPAIDGLTQARRLSEVEDMARSYIAIDQDIAPSEIQLRNPHVVVSGEDLGATMRDILEFRKTARLAEEKAAALMVETARRLASHKVPLRDIGEVLGVSHQRVHQLVQEFNTKSEALNATNRKAIRASNDGTERGRQRVAAKKVAAPGSRVVVAAPARKAAANASRKLSAAAKETSATRRRKAV